MQKGSSMGTPKPTLCPIPLKKQCERSKQGQLKTLTLVILWPRIPSFHLLKFSLAGFPPLITAKNAFFFQRIRSPSLPKQSQLQAKTPETPPINVHWRWNRTHLRHLNIIDSIEPILYLFRSRVWLSAIFPC